jgi:hypothetical protein
MERLAAHE